MKKVIIMSDTHGLVHEITEIRDKHEADKVIHCGDSELYKEDTVLEGAIVVEGNCDQSHQFNNEEIIEIDGLRFYVTHGHLYQVKQQLMTLSCRASEMKADIVCFGHSHIVYAEQDDHHLYINPGSVRFPRVPTIPTYVELTIKHQEILWVLWSLEGEQVDSKVFQRRRYV